MVTTRGDNYNIACPYCGKINHYPVKHKFNKDKVLYFKNRCFHCVKQIRYTARYEMTLLAETINSQLNSLSDDSLSDSDSLSNNDLVDQG